jgi:hypothetical protein
MKVVPVSASGAVNTAHSATREMLLSQAAADSTFARLLVAAAVCAFAGGRRRAVAAAGLAVQTAPPHATGESAAHCNKIFVRAAAVACMLRASLACIRVVACLTAAASCSHERSTHSFLTHTYAAMTAFPPLSQLHSSQACC